MVKQMLIEEQWMFNEIKKTGVECIQRKIIYDPSLFNQHLFHHFKVLTKIHITKMF